MGRVAALAGVLLATGLSCLPGGADACACGDFSGPVVARGTSLYGVPWKIEVISPRRARAEGSVAFHFSMEEPGYAEAGYFSGMPFPVPRTLVFHALAGSDIDPYPEGDLSGFAPRRVSVLTVAMSDGSHLTEAPEEAPAALVNRFPWLGGLRFFDIYFPSAIRPVKLAARDRNGVLLARTRRQPFLGVQGRR